MPEQIEAHTPIHLGTALMMFIYALAILVIGLWAYGILPANCNNSQLRLSLRALIVMGAIMITMYIGYALCFERCETHTVDENIIPSMILIFNIAMSLGCVISLGIALSQFNQDDTCNTAPSFDNCKYMITMMLVISVLSLVVYIGIFVYFNLKKAKKGSQEKAEAEALARANIEDRQKRAQIEAESRRLSQQEQNISQAASQIEKQRERVRDLERKNTEREAHIRELQDRFSRTESRSGSSRSSRNLPEYDSREMSEDNYGHDRGYEFPRGDRLYHDDDDYI